MTTMQDALDRLEAGEFDYSPQNRLKIRGSARKCARLPAYNCPLERIPADPESFRRRWARNMERHDQPEGFTTFESFRDWHSNVNGLMERASGLHAAKRHLRGQRDGWTMLAEAIGALVRPGRQGTGIRHEDLIAVGVLANTAREAGRAPRDLTTDCVVTWLDRAERGQKRALRRAARTLDGLRGYPDLAGQELLPAEPIGELPRVTRRRRTPEFPVRIRQAIDAHIAMLGQGRPLSGLLSHRTGRALSSETVRTERDSLHWFFACVVELGMIAPGADPDPREFADIVVIMEVLDAETAGRLPWRRLAPRTLRRNLECAFRFLQRHVPDLKLHREDVFGAVIFDGLNEMTEENRAFCKRLVEETARCRTFLNLSALLLQEAAPMIAAFDTLSSSQRQVAVDLALGAALAAVLTFLPLRARTLQELVCEGPDAHVWLDPKGKQVSFTIPGEIVKNSKKIVATIDRRGRSDPHAVLDWWRSTGRQQLMPAIRRPDARRLFGGANYGRLAKAWKFATARHDLFMQLHQARHAIASILMNPPNPDVEMIAALLGDTPATVRKTYAFFHTELAVSRGQDGLKHVNKMLEAGRRAK